MPRIGKPKIVRELLDRPLWSIVLHVLPFAILIAFPLIFDLERGRGSSIGNVLLIVQIYIILALGLNIVVGYTGLLDLGFVTFMATGALVSCLGLMIVVTPEGWVLPGGRDQMPPGHHLFGFEGGYFVIILIAGLVCALLGYLRGIPTLRLSGDYYAIVTLGLAEIIYLFYFNEEWLTGGAFGLKLTMDARPTLMHTKLYYDQKEFYYLVLAMMGLTIYAMYRLQNSRLGRAWAAIRLDETAARTCGINVSAYKSIAFSTSGFFGGIGGALYPVWSGTVAIRDFDIWQSIIVLCAVVFGGMGSTRGVLLGTVVMISLGEILRLEIFGLRVPQQARYLIYGMLLIFLMRFRPQGLIPRIGDSSPPAPQDEQAMRRATSPLFVLNAPRKQSPGHQPSEPDNILETADLTRYFGGLKAVDGLNLSAQRGHITSLIGPNGAGKTTVFNAISNIFAPTRGQIQFRPAADGNLLDITGCKSHRICKIGVARTFQNIRLFSDLPVLENVKVGLHCHTRSNVFGALFTPPNTNCEERDVEIAAIHYLEFVGLYAQANELATNLSYGDQRRLEIARALATQAQLILFDEPAAGMNPQETEQLMDLIEKIRVAGVTVLLIEHDMKLVMRISDYVYVLDHGILICEGPPAVVQADKRVIEAYLGSEA